MKGGDMVVVGAWGHLEITFGENVVPPHPKEDTLAVREMSEACGFDGTECLGYFHSPDSTGSHARPPDHYKSHDCPLDQPPHFSHHKFHEHSPPTERNDHH